MTEQIFDEIVNRKGTSCYKYDWRQKIFNTDDVLPMWVADTDFKAPDFIVDAIKKRLEHGIFGYTFCSDSYYQSVVDWMKKRHNWSILKEWIQHSPGVVPSLNLAVLSLTDPGDEIVVQSPVYFPFYSAVKDHNRKLIVNPLVLQSGRYYMDLANLEKEVTSNTKLFFLCSPHNPTGNVWRKEELEQLANFCLERNIILISDEIHSDIIYPGYKHIPTATLSNDISNITLTLSSPSKTFNIAGFSSSYVISSNKTILKKISKAIDNLHIGNGNLFGHITTEAAYNHGEEWLNSLINYLSSNVHLARSYIRNHLPDIELIEPESTFLLWLDFRKLRLEHNELKSLLIEKGKIGLSDGGIFGKEGYGFQRMNIGYPKQIIKEALERINHAIYN